MLAPFKIQEAPYLALERLLVYNQPGPHAAEVRTYAQYLGELLGWPMSSMEPEAGAPTAINRLVEAAGHDVELVIFGEQTERSLFRRLLSQPTVCRLAGQLPASLLAVRKPTWPLEKILWITRGQFGVDETAIDWLARLARPSGAQVTTLALAPDIPMMCQRAMTTMSHGLADWLSSDTPLGEQLRTLTHRLDGWEIEGRLHFRQGAPRQQIQTELEAEAYDLVVLAADPQDWWGRRLLGDLVCPVLRDAQQPVLIAKR